MNSILVSVVPLAMFTLSAWSEPSNVRKDVGSNGMTGDGFKKPRGSNRLNWIAHLSQVA